MNWHELARVQFVKFVPKAVDFPMPLDPEIPLLESSLKEIIININKDLGSKMSTIDS